MPYSKRSRLCLLKQVVIAIAASTVTGVLAAATDPSPVFHASFDSDLAARVNGDEKTPPLMQRNLVFEQGIQRRAVYIGGQGERDSDNAPCLVYPANDLLDGDEGTLMFWVKPNWDGGDLRPDTDLWYTFLSAVNPRGDLNLRIWMWNWLRCDVSVASSEKPAQLVHAIRGAWQRKDWWHITFSWQRDGWSTLYVNGLPFWHGFGYAPGPTQFQRPVSLEDTSKLYVGCMPKGRHGAAWRANATIDELKIYRQALSDEQVMRDFRRHMPLDLALDRRFLEANRKETVTLDVWPGGQMVKPQTGTPVSTPVETPLDLALTSRDGEKVFASRRFTLKLSGRRSLSMNVGSLQQGAYRVRVRIPGEHGSFEANYPVAAYRQPRPAPANNRPVELGDPIVEIDCTETRHGFIAGGKTTVESLNGTGYREADDARKSRFSYEITFPEDYRQGQPVMLEVTWPDDKPRSMGLYMYRESDRKQSRGRLQGGIQSGNEYHASNTMKTTSTIFFPWMANYLFEARTVIEGYPAAVSRIVIRPILGRLPKLALNTPASGEPARRFGHFDEDQTFEVPLLFERPQKTHRPLYAVNVLERLLDYMDYTGQTIMNQQAIRYESVYYDLPGARNGGGHFRQRRGWLTLMLDMFERRGKKLILSVNAYTVPEAIWRPDWQERRLAEGYYLLRSTGKPARNRRRNYLPNPLHPECRDQLLDHISEVARRFGKHPAAVGIDLWPREWLLNDLDLGYGDFTIGLFEQDTGIRVPGSGNERFATRHRFLNGPKRDAWLAWRADNKTALIAEIRKIVNAHAPGLQLFLIQRGKPMAGDVDSLTGTSLDVERYYFEECGLERDALLELPSVSFTPMRFPTNFRWQLHRNNRFTTGNELLTDLSRYRYFRHDGINCVYNFHKYFESRGSSLKPQTYATYFQNADIKPHGRFFLKELAYSLAAVDATHLLAGGQPLGTSGRDAVSREFARAFTALPQADFKDVPGMTDPVKVRTWRSADGTYLYAVNLLQFPAEATMQLPGADRLRDLSTHQQLPLNAGEATVRLQPFQLRSFSVPGQRIHVKPGKATVPEDVVRNYRHHLARLESMLAVFKRHGADTTLYEKRINRIKAAVKEGAYAEAHRLIQSKLMRLMPEHADFARKGYLKTRKEMIARQRYAVNCGSEDYYTSAGGVLFFPDRKFTAGGYGFFGSHKSTIHSVSALPADGDRKLFFHEAYNVDGYRFTVKPGMYTVRLYNRVGYKPNMKPGKVIMSVIIEGRRVMDQQDLFTACNQNPGSVCIRTLDGIAVHDETLDIHFSSPIGTTQINAIEVLPQQR